METRVLKLLQKGKRLLQLGQATDAVDYLAKAVGLCPDDPEILAALAEAHQRNNSYIPALEAYDRIIELGAATAGTWLATANALADCGEHAQSIGAYENSLELDDTNPETHHNLARACYRMGEVSRAAQHLELALELHDSIQSWQNLANLVPALPEADHGRILKTRQQFARKLAEWTGTPWPVPEDRPSPRRREGPLRIGYVCAFFHNANYTKPVWGLINHHDRSKFQVSLFSDSPADDGMPCYLPQPQDEVHDVRNLDNDQLTALIRSAEIDILVDLNAYSFESRLGLFLRYPAPVNVAWWAMYATSGLPCLEYLVGDDEMTRPGELDHFSEEVLYLPVSYLSFTVDYPVPPVTAPPCTTQEHFTFGSLVTQYKITPEVMDAWAAMLRGAPRARLFLANQGLKSKQNGAYVLEQFARRDVDPDRITLKGPAEHTTYLRYYEQIDLALDAFPYNGGTTTMEAIWQGVPVLTFDGDRWISRTTQTLLKRCHLSEFVAADVEDMVARGIYWATRADAREKLVELRSKMRAKLANSSACDTPGLAKGMEILYEKIWSRATGNK